MDIVKYYDEKGTGSAIVFIHGSYASTSTWIKMVEHLSQNHHCILIKLPGHCGTPDPEDFSDPSIETELVIIEQVVKSLTDKPIHLVGHSFGGVIALATALKGSLKINQMSLFEPVAISTLNNQMKNVIREFLAEYRLDAVNKVPFACGQVIDFWAGKGAFQSLPNFIKEGMEPLVLNNIRHWDCEAAMNYKAADLTQINIPTRLICGTNSNPIADAICDSLNILLPHSNKYIIEGASHFLVTSHVSECIKVLSEQPG